MDLALELFFGVVFVAEVFALALDLLVLDFLDAAAFVAFGADFAVAFFAADFVVGFFARTFFVGAFLVVFCATAFLTAAFFFAGSDFLEDVALAAGAVFFAAVFFGVALGVVFF